MTIGLLDIGGGSRDIFGTAILDYCLDEGIDFDYCIGISAGAANVVSYLAKQPRRTKEFYLEYFFRKEYASLSNFFKKRNYVDLTYPYLELSAPDGENPLDRDAFLSNPAKFYTEVCDAYTAEGVYYEKSEVDYDTFVKALMASATLPVVCTPVNIGDRYAYDGGLADAIPLKKCFEDGCDKVVLFLTRPIDEERTPDSDIRSAKFIRRRYPAIADILEKRADMYNAGLRYARELEAEGKVLILAPKSIEGLKTLTRDRPRLEAMYDEGYAIAKRIDDFVR